MKLTQIQNMIYEIRGYKVMLDSDLAALYSVELKVMNQAVKRNIGRFPADFMFQLKDEEWDCLRSQIVISKSVKPPSLPDRDRLRSQIVTSKSSRGGRRYAPYVFTEQGVSMLSSVINSKRAIEVNINIMRTFVKLRRYVFSQNGADGQIAELRKLLMLYIEKNDKRVNDIIIVLNNLMERPPKTRTIGFNAGN